MNKANWIWMPHAGHFVLGESCKFKLNTYVGNYIVSTVGEMWSERAIREIHAEFKNLKWLQENKNLLGDEFDYAYMKEFGYDEVGTNRKYETMVFKAKKSENKCCPYEIIVEENVDMLGCNAPYEAYVGHLKLCEKWSKE